MSDILFVFPSENTVRERFTRQFVAEFSLRKQFFESTIKMDIIHRTRIIDVNIHGIVSRASYINDTAAVRKNLIKDSLGEHIVCAPDRAELSVKCPQLFVCIHPVVTTAAGCLLYTSDAADD